MEIICCFFVGILVLGLLGIVVDEIIDVFKSKEIKNVLICFGILALFSIIATAIGYLIIYAL